MAIIGRIRKKSGYSSCSYCNSYLIICFQRHIYKNKLHPNNMVQLIVLKSQRNEFEEMSQNIETNMKQQYQSESLNPEQSYTGSQQAYQELLNEKLLTSEYEKIGITVGKRRIKRYVFLRELHPPNGYSKFLFRPSKQVTITNKQLQYIAQVR